MPNVIYMPQPIGGLGTLGASIGNFLGTAGGQSLQNWNVGRAIDATAGMDAQQQTEELTRRLGPEGTKLARDIIANRVSESNLALNKLRTATELLQQQREQFVISHQDEVLRNQQGLVLSEITKNRATAAGEMARAAAEGSISAYHQQQIASSKAAMEREAVEFPLKLKELAAKAAQEDMNFQMNATLLRSMGGTFGDVTTPEPARPAPGVAPATPAGQPDFRPSPIVGPGAGGVTAQPIPLATTGTLPGVTRVVGGDQIAPSGSEAGGAFDRKVMEGLDVGKMPDLKVYNPAEVAKEPLDPTTAQEIVAGGGFGKAQAGRAMEERTKPVHVEKRFISPKVYFNEGVMRSGQRVVMGGVVDERTPMTDAERANQSGVAQMYTAIKAMDDLRSGAKLGDASVRLFNSALMAAKQPAIGQGATTAMAINALTAHVILPIMSYARGNRPTDTLRDQMMSIIATYGQSPEMADMIARTSFAVFRPMIKDLIDTSRAEGKHVDIQLSQLYSALKLDDPGLDMSTMLSDAEKVIVSLPKNQRIKAYGGTLDPPVDREGMINDLVRDSGKTREQVLKDLGIAR